jgi:hypothetical protein
MKMVFSRLHHIGSWFLFLVFFSLNQGFTQSDYGGVQPRIIITADPELDDQNSLIRFLLYSNEVKIAGLIYASSGFHWKGDGSGKKWFVPGREYDRFKMDVCPCTSWRWKEGESFIDDVVDAYSKSYKNLKIHDPKYPNPDELESVIRYGNIEFDGDYSKDTPGSELIESLILDELPGPLFITAWGGGSTIARALYAIESKFSHQAGWNELKSRISKKVVLLPSGDQDDTFAKYIEPHWPQIEIRKFSNVPSYGYGAQINAKASNLPFLSADWMTEYVTSRGPLGALYRVWGDGQQMVEGDQLDYFGLKGLTAQELRDRGYIVWLPPQEAGSWLGEGDNHTVMNMLGNGLNAYKEAYYGGWGGYQPIGETGPSRFQLSPDATEDDMAALLSSSKNIPSEFPDFFPQAQNDFAARMIWATTDSYEQANHHPQSSLEVPSVIKAVPNQRVSLFGNAVDPEGDAMEVKWWLMPNGTYQTPVSFEEADSFHPIVVIPEEALVGEAYHIIMEVKDSGTPQLTTYQRVILKVLD